MPGPFASTVFSSGAQDSFRAVDVYNQSGKGTLSSYQDKSTAPSTAGLGSLFGGGTTGFNLSTIDALKTAQNTLAYGKGVTSATDNKSALDRAINGMGSLASNLRSAPGGLQSALMSNISGAQSIYATVGNTVARLKSGNLPDIRSVTSMINAVAGSNLINISDQNSIVGMTAGLVQQATSYGIPKSFSALTKNLTANPALLANVYDNVMPSISKLGSIRELKDVTSISPIDVKRAAPDILGDFSFNYKKEDGSVATAVTEFSDVKSTFTQIDPSWNSTFRTGGDTMDLSTFCKASPDLKDTLKIGAFNSTDANDKLYLLADHIPTTDVRDQLKASFPLTAYGNNATPDPEPVVQSPAVASGATTVREYGSGVAAGGREIMVKETTYPDGASKKEFTTPGQFSFDAPTTVTKYYNANGQEAQIAGEADTWTSAKKVNYYVKDDIEHTVYTQTNSKGTIRTTTTRVYTQTQAQLPPIVTFGEVTIK